MWCERFLGVRRPLEQNMDQLLRVSGFLSAPRWGREGESDWIITPFFWLTRPKHACKSTKRQSFKSHRASHGSHCWGRLKNPSGELAEGTPDWNHSRVRSITCTDTLGEEWAAASEVWNPNLWLLPRLPHPHPAALIWRQSHVFFLHSIYAACG